MSMRIVGIDPGQDGGFAILDGIKLIAGLRMPTLLVRTKQVIDANGIADWLDHWKPEVGIIELVGARPGQGSPAGFAQGRSFGGVEAIMTCFTGSQHHVTPNVWKGKLGLSKDKSASISKATHLFGEAARKEWWPNGPKGGQPFDGIAEAALIAYYWLQHVSK